MQLCLFLYLHCAIKTPCDRWLKLVLFYKFWTQHHHFASWDPTSFFSFLIFLYRFSFIMHRQRQLSSMLCLGMVHQMPQLKLEISTGFKLDLWTVLNRWVSHSSRQMTSVDLVQSWARLEDVQWNLTTKWSHSLAIHIVNDPL
jgi:hypothetical protein